MSDEKRFFIIFLRQKEVKKQEWKDFQSLKAAVTDAVAYAVAYVVADAVAYAVA